MSSKRKKFEAITHVSTLPQIEEDAMRDGYDILFTEVATRRAATSSGSPSLSAIACISANVKGPAASGFQLRFGTLDFYAHGHRDVQLALVFGPGSSRDH